MSLDMIYDIYSPHVKGVQDSLGLSIPRRGFQIPASEFRIPTVSGIFCYFLFSLSLGSRIDVSNGVERQKKAHVAHLRG